MIGNLFRGLFGGGADDNASGKAETEQYEGFTLLASPVKEAHGWRVSGTITRGSGEDVKTHKFDRADTSPSREEAIQITFRKARQIIDERGERVFN